MGRPDPEFNSSTPGGMEMTEMTTKRIYDGVSSAVATVSYGEENIDGRRSSCCRLKGVEYVYIGVMAVAVLTIVLSVSLVFALKGEDDVQYLPRVTVIPTPPPRPTAPTRPPTTHALRLTRPPSTASPTSAAFALLPEYTQDSFEDPDSPQRKAFEWISSAGVGSMEEWRMKQLFALATCCYDLGGPNWRISGWLDETQSECLWPSSAINPGNNDADSYGLATCNERGEVQAIRLNGMLNQSDLRLRPHLPPELALLTSLKSIQLDDNRMYNTLEILLDAYLQISQIESLQDLSLANNSLYGSLPKELGLFTTLRRLQLQKHHLRFAIPTELGTMTALESLHLNDNSLRGVIPSELGLLTGLTVLDLSNNNIYGAIPSEILALPNLAVFNKSGNPL